MAVTTKRKRSSRSRITNGTSLLPNGADGRGAWVRRCRDLVELHTSDRGGADNLSSAERSIVRRCAVIETELEMLEMKFAHLGQAGSEDLHLYQRTAANLRRLFQAIGMKRRPKNVTPSVSEYVAHIAAVEEVGAE
jgi:hypothetical protein